MLRVAAVSALSLLVAVAIIEGCGTSGTGGSPVRGPAASGTSEPPRVDATVPPVEAKHGGGQVLTSRNDNGRTGAQLEEDVLDPTTVKGLAPVGSYSVDGEMFAQPLVASSVTTPNGAKNLLVVATMNNRLYAFDIDQPNSSPVWQKGDESFGKATSTYGGLSQHGILSTPVIDRTNDRVYVVSRTSDGKTSTHRLSSFALGSGALIHQTTLSGSAAGVTFDNNAEWNRPGLLLQGGKLYIAFGAGPTGSQHEEDFVYHGWVLTYDAETLNPLNAYCSTPRRKGGGIWQAGSGLAADNDSLYFVTGNSVLANEVRPPAEYPAVPGDHENSVVKLPIANPTFVPGTPGPLTYFDDRAYVAAGNVFQHMEANDVDFGSAGPLLIPNSSVLVSGSKSGIVYGLDRGTMKQLQTPVNAFTALPLQPGNTLYIHSWWGTPVICGSLSYWKPDDAANGYVYGWAFGDRLTSLKFDPATSQLAIDHVASPAAIARGGLLAISSHGGRNGIVWASTQSPTTNGGHLWAFDATTLATLIDFDTPAQPQKFTPPTVAQGRVFIATSSGAVTVYGLPAKP